MASNKLDTVFEPLEVNEYTITYTGLYGEKTEVTGSPRQIINLILNQQKV